MYGIMHVCWLFLNQILVANKIIFKKRNNSNPHAKSEFAGVKSAMSFCFECGILFFEAGAVTRTQESLQPKFKVPQNGINTSISTLA
jgi:hypothetical protein